MRFEAGLDGVVFDSGGCQLLGGFYRAAGETPRPTAVLLHGVPGVEKNLDLACALRDAGWNCLYFHYRGCWGSEGEYAFHGLHEDVHAAARWVRGQPCVDPERLALVGSSLGGYLALVAGAADPRFRALVAMCPLVDPVEVPLPLEVAAEFARMLQGVSAHELQAQWKALPAVREVVPQLARRAVLLVSGERDPFFSVAHHRPLAEALAAFSAGGQALFSWVRLAEGDHTFSRCRRALVRTIVTWLEERLGD